MSNSRAGTALITGGTTGLGYEAALAIAKAKPNWTIIIASRNNSDDAAATISKRSGNKNVRFESLDLSSLANIRTFVDTYKTQNNPPIRALLMNAALQVINGPQYTAEGYEKTFGITHLGHALLFHLLYPSLAPDARVVVTASGVHDPAQKSGVPEPIFENAEEVAHPPEDQKYVGIQRYSTSKLCNVLWCYALERRLAKLSNGHAERVTINSFDPGLMPGTGLARDHSGVGRFLWFNVLPYLVGFLRLIYHHNVHTVAESGGNLANLAIGDKDKGVTGKYYEGSTAIDSSVDSMKEDKQEDLWSWTVKALAKDAEEKKTFDMV